MAPQACLQAPVADICCARTTFSNSNASLPRPRKVSETSLSQRIRGLRCLPIAGSPSTSRKLKAASLVERNVQKFSFSQTPARRGGVTVCAGLGDFIGGDLSRLDIGKWLDQVNKFGAVATYAPPEGGYEGRYATSLKNDGYEIMNMTARGLGDPEAYLMKVHGVRPPHLGKQAVARFYLPPEVDYRLQFLAPNSKGLVIWILECQVLSKAELQYLLLLPVLRPNVKVIAEMGSAREFTWKPLKDLVGLPPAPKAETPALKPFPVPEAVPQKEKEPVVLRTASEAP
eukprot:TRINITY_DN9772_c0_g1_i1.p1 TRINITY_DN9772_c0_g1~~TRINITY_DN9772_c0_g1_i1.p1  ORF type:complete len:286 (-),score=53.49 TRINITY_DN9772_c0_g1_i1:643-1500(-)